MKTSLRTLMLVVATFTCAAAFFGLFVRTDAYKVGISYGLALLMMMLLSFSVTGASIAYDKTPTPQSALHGTLAGFYIGFGIVSLVVFYLLPHTHAVISWS